MNLTTYLFDLLPKIINYRLGHMGLVKYAKPITVTFSVTAACQSLCKTCNIGAHYFENPQVRREDLTLEEIEKVFKNIGHIYFLNISGGEPYMRKDLPQIIELACKYLTPRIIHIPTNALAPAFIEKCTVQILETIKKYNPHTPLTVKPSIDGVGEKHDEVRGVKGNFRKLEETILRLKKLQSIYANLYLELGTVVSNFNVDHLDEIEDYVHSLGVESYRNEVAEQRAEFFNVGDPITPTGDVYDRLMKQFTRKIEENVGRKRRLTRIHEAFRMVYYEVAGRILREQTQVIPCYGGISNVHINANGEIWPCAVLGYSKPMGNLREADYDFKKIYRSAQARQVRKYIYDKNCHCPLANQWYANILLNVGSMLKVGRQFLSWEIRRIFSPRRKSPVVSAGSEIEREPRLDRRGILPLEEQRKKGGLRSFKE